MVRLISLSFVIWPSVWPLVQGPVLAYLGHESAELRDPVPEVLERLGPRGLGPRGLGPASACLVANGASGEVAEPLQFGLVGLNDPAAGRPVYARFTDGIAPCNRQAAR